METVCYPEKFLSTSQTTDPDGHNMKIVNLGFHKSGEVLDYVSEQLLFSEEKLCSKEFYSHVNRKRVFCRPLREVRLYLI
jgi:hypothetical protein